MFGENHSPNGATFGVSFKSLPPRWGLQLIFDLILAPLAINLRRFAAIQRTIGESASL